MLCSRKNSGLTLKKKKHKHKDAAHSEESASGVTEAEILEALNKKPEPAQSRQEAPFQFAIVAALFILSGLSSLIYQVIWTRQLVFVFGSTTFASSTVLSVFMGGLALGAFLAGRFSEKTKNPFFWYGILELFIGIWALFAPQLFELATPIYKIAWQHTHMSALPFSFLRFVVVSIILLPPTASMGATLPLLSRFVTSSMDLVADRVGTLYALNTFGAVCGAVLAGFYLIPSFGLNISTVTAAAINILLALAVCFLCTRWQDRSADDESPPAESTSKEKIPLQVVYILIAFGFSGAIAMINEVAWTRALLMIIGSTTYAFSVMLSTFLLGIFTGSLALARIADRLKQPFFWFAIMQICVCAAGILSVYLFNYFPYWNLIANSHFARNPDAGMYIRFGLASIVLVPITVFLGAMFPLAVKTCSNDLAKVGRSVGTLYSANTLGAIIGAAAAGFLVIPALGGEQTLLACAVANYVLGYVLLLLSRKQGLAIRIASSIALVILCAWLGSKPEIWDKRIVVASQRERRILSATPDLPSYEEWKDVADKRLKILYWKDGLCSNVAVAQSFKTNNISLFTNGHIDASLGSGDLVTQAALAAIPMLIRPTARDVAVVGWGSGTTAGYTFLFPVQKLVCAELEKYVFETSPYFHKINFEAEKDPRLQMEINDGRNYLLATDETFDLLISEPSNPWQAGVCNLYTKEFFEICKARLKKDGIFALWWQGNEVSVESLKKVMAALKQSFGNVTVFCAEPGNYCALATLSPLRIDLSVVAAALKNKKVRDATSGSMSITYADDLAAMLCMADDGIEKAIAGSPLNTDDRNYIEFEVAKTYEQKSFSVQNLPWFVDNAGSLWNAIEWKNYTPAQKAEELAMIAECASRLHRETAEFWARESFKAKPNVHGLAIMVINRAQNQDDYPAALQKLEEEAKFLPGENRLFYLRGLVQLHGGALLKARKNFQKAIAAEPTNNNYRYRLAQTYFPEPKAWYLQAAIPLADDGIQEMNPHKAMEILNSISASDPNFFEKTSEAAKLQAAVQMKVSLDNGIKLMEAFLKKDRGDSASWQLLADAYSEKNELGKANACRSQAQEKRLAESASILKKAQRRYDLGSFKLALAGVAKALELNPKSEDAQALLDSLSTKYPPAQEFRRTARVQ